ncbi:hypothetical protein H5410_056557 [Solanum commersonii]|uniref:Uncharacterized protein n=1 Tax=Solanum commersonii TaxID=4109 RepID=A0A9J5WMI9_SOLCO|nr:hypothetical protein H5410_056557 [Solanum commersonii]
MAVFLSGPTDSIAKTIAHRNWQNWGFTCSKGRLDGHPQKIMTNIWITKRSMDYSTKQNQQNRRFTYSRPCLTFKIGRFSHRDQPAS